NGRNGEHGRPAVNSMARFVVDVYLSSDGPVRVHAPGPTGKDAAALGSSDGFIQAVSAGPAGLGSKAEALKGRWGQDSGNPDLERGGERSVSLESEGERTRAAVRDHGGPLGWDPRPKRTSRWRFVITFVVAVVLVSVTTAANIHRRVQGVNIDWQL